MAAPIANTIEPPPRSTGRPEIDGVGALQYLWAFYTKAILTGGLLQPQNMDPALISLGELAASADTIAYFTAEDTFDLTGFTAFARTLLDDADASEARDTLGAGTVRSVTGSAPIVSDADPVNPDISISDFAASGAAHARGAVPDPGAAAGTTKYLREDATWDVPPGLGDVVGPAGATANHFAQFDGATGKLIKGGLALSTSTTLVENSDTVIASQKAIKAYADALLAANDAMVYKGATDCSGNPNYPAANAGDTYRVSVAGRIGGAAGKVVESGDWYICNADATASGDEAAVGSSWNVIQTNIDGAVIGPAGVTGDHVALFDGATGRLIKSGGALGTMSAQAASNVAITGGAIDGTPVGGTTKAAGGFTTVTATSAIKPQSDPTTDWGVDPASRGTTAIVDTGTADLATGSGLVALHCNDTGEFALFACWAGNVEKFALGSANVVAGAPAAGQIGLYYNGGTGKYRIENQQGATRNIYITTIKTRTAS